MTIIIWIIVGAIAGWIASLLVGASQGLISDIIVGMIGSIIGGALVILLQGGGLDFTTAFTGFNLTSVLVSTLGAVVLLLLVKALGKPRGTTTR